MFCNTRVLFALVFGFCRETLTLIHRFELAVADLEAVTSVTSEEEDEPSSTTEESEPTTTKEERTTTEAEVTSSAVEKVVTSTLPNGSKTVVTSTTYVEVVAGGGEPTAEPTDPDLQNVAVGLSAGPVGSLMAAFIATVYLLA